jgi:hypothetical protein
VAGEGAILPSSVRERNHPLRTAQSRRVGVCLRVVSALLLPALSGCAFDNVGFLAGKVTRASDAVVIDVYQLGVHLRTVAEDAGVSLGVAQRTYFYSVDQAGSLPAGWHYFIIPMPDERAQVLDTRNIGVEIRATAPQASVTIGYRQTTILANVSSDASIVLRAAYDSSDRRRTRLQYCREGRTC